MFCIVSLDSELSETVACESSRCCWNRRGEPPTALVLARSSSPVRLAGRYPLFSRPSFSIADKPEVLPLVLVLDIRPAEGSPFSLSRVCFCLNFCCFRFNPWSKLMMMSLILGRYFSKLSTLASWLSVASRMCLSSSGTLPRSEVSTLMAVKARHAMLNS